MIFPNNGVLQSFPSTLTHRNATVCTIGSTDGGTQQAIQDLIDARHLLQDRISAPLKGMENELFAKSQPLDSLKPKLRVTFGRAKRDGTYDWPVEEVINTLGAQKRGAPSPTSTVLAIESQHWALSRSSSSSPRC